MTNQEAIETLNLHNPFMSNNTILSEAMDMAVKSLKNSNSVAISTLEELAQEIEDMDYDSFVYTEDIFIKIYEHIAKLKGENKLTCDRNICLQNEYNNIGCEDCAVTKGEQK